MQPSLNRATLVVALAAVSSGIALAAPKPSQPQTPPVAGTATLGLEVQETELITTGWRASKLIGDDVENEKKEKIGKIDDFVIAPDGTLSVATIETGGFLGVGSHRVAIPMRQLKLSATDPKVVLPGATKDSLKKLPDFKYVK